MRYRYLDKPAYIPETETISPDYKIEDGVFIAGWKVEKIPDEDGYTPTPAEQPDDAPTLRDRVDLLESVTDDMILLMAELIGGKENASA